MKDVKTLARAFLRTRGDWVKLRSQQVMTAEDQQRLVSCESAMQALAWTLDVDLRIMNMPKVGDFTEPEAVTITRIEDYQCWLVEIPRSVEGEMIPTEFAAFFLSDRHMRELEAATSGVRLQLGREMMNRLRARRAALLDGGDGFPSGA